MKEIIKNFNNNKSKDLYEKILLEHIKDYKMCKLCNHAIYYYDSIFSLSKLEKCIYPNKKSYLTFKEIYETKYYLCICEDCLTKKFPEYQNKNKSRVFNMLNEITVYAFNIPDNIFKQWKKENYNRTLENYIKKFGEDDGNRRWKEYCDKQAKSNTYEYKKEKFGWSIDEFNKFNKSRAVTIENLILNHGEEKGLEIWNNYIERQRYTCSKEYFLKTYGEDVGTNKWNKFIVKRSFICQYSDISQKLFFNIKDKLDKNYTYFFALNNNEYNIGGYLLDFYIKELNIGIEFNGDKWHGNPIKYKENDNPDPFNKNITAKDIWEKDTKRLNFLKTRLKDIIVVWENDLILKGLEVLSEELVKKIKTYE